MGVEYSQSRPWGSWYVLEEGPGYKVKRIVVLPGKRLSLQSHRYREEHWTVVRGQALVQIDERQFMLSPGERGIVPLGARHRLTNPGTDELWVVEVQCGSSTAEEDIVRYEDDFGRL